MGVVELQPTRLLEDGLRAHLAQRAAAAAATAMSFSNPPSPLAYPPLSTAGRSAFANLFGAGASLSPSIPGRCGTLLNDAAAPIHLLLQKSIRAGCAWAEYALMHSVCSASYDPAGR